VEIRCRFVQSEPSDLKRGKSRLQLVGSRGRFYSAVPDGQPGSDLNQQFKNAGYSLGYILAVFATILRDVFSGIYLWTAHNTASINQQNVVAW
jgi:hypothetical protein